MDPSVTRLPPSNTVCTASKPAPEHPVQVCFTVLDCDRDPPSTARPLRPAAPLRTSNAVIQRSETMDVAVLSIHGFEDGEAILSMMSGRKRPCPQGWNCTGANALGGPFAFVRFDDLVSRSPKWASKTPGCALAVACACRLRPGGPELPQRSIQQSITMAPHLLLSFEVEQRELVEMLEGRMLPDRTPRLQELHHGLPVAGRFGLSQARPDGRVHRKAVPWVFHQPVWGQLDHAAVNTLGRLVRPPGQRHAALPGCSP